MAVNVHVIECTVDPTMAPDMVGQHWINTTNGCHFLSNGTTSIANWVKINAGELVTEVVVPSTTTTNLQTVPLTEFCAIKYHLCAHNVAQDVWKSVIIHASKTTSTTVDDSIFSSLGGPLDFDTQFSVIATDGVLSVTNNEAFSITFRFRSEII